MKHWYWDLGLAAIAVFIISTPVQAQQQAPQEFNFKLTAPELDMIGKALGTQPFNDAAPIIQKLREQFMAQQPKPAEPEKK